ncbi:MAG: hypothetical protein CMLOHMNK_02061 [Steroidobacteraceae bacterium]|nr:hypothetical protein [Steroidobacteraceae bacterium]
MTPGNLIRFCANQGIRLAAVDGELHATGRALTEKRAAWLKDAKEGILRYLHFTADPRPDLADDHNLWQRLLPLAYEEDGEATHGAFGALHGLRCAGGRLQAKPEGGLVLAGDPAEPDAWRTAKRDFLAPHKEVIAKLLSQLT